MVSMAITAILMLGMSVFFSSTFQSLFQSQIHTENTGKQFAVNEIIKDKFTKLDKVLNPDDFKDSPPSSDRVLFENQITPNQLPFSYIGAHENHIVFKDMLIFNKIYYDNGASFFADSGNGQIKSANSGNERVPRLDPPDKFKNFSSFEIIGSTYYIVFPDKNKVMECTCDASICSYDNCQDLPNISQLKSPTDITKDRDAKYIYISDSGDGKVIKYDVVNQKELDSPNSPVGTGLKYPTGLAYYYDGTTEWLFVAETFGNKVRKINLTSPSVISTVVGDGDDAECKHTAKFCKLNMPTGIFADDVKNELYISDSGNNRILKMKDPGKPDNLSFDFNLNDNYALDRIEFANDKWDGTGNYDETGSNLIGSSSNFINKKFQNSDRLTTFSNSICQISGNSFYVNEQPPSVLKSGDKLIIGSNTYTVSTPGNITECKLLPDDSSLMKWLITVGSDEDTSAIADGQPVYFSNPKEVKVKITGILAPAFTGTGFQTFTIKTYDISKGLVGTNYSSVRIGDGKLGTDEDTIDVIDMPVGSPTISFPTGVTDGFFANSGAYISTGKKVISFSSGSQDFSPISIDAFDTFDYVSDFLLADTDGIKFKILNTYKLLELVVNAMIDETNSQTYVLDAAILNK
jgi:hypothetical protein